MKSLLALMIVAVLTGPGAGQSINLFNSRDLQGWEGDPARWTVENGAIVGRVAEGTQVEDHTYLIWQGGPVRDFELSLKFRSDAGNSGVDYRARHVTEGRHSRDLRWTLQGYQADIVQNWMGSFYNWQLAGAQPGQFAIITTAAGARGGQATRVFPLADANTVRSIGYYRPEQWNEYAITVRGEHVIHRINGFQTVEVIDVSDARRAEGYLGFQVHAGSKEQVHMFKDIRLTPLHQTFGRPLLLRRAPQASRLLVTRPEDAPAPGPDALAFAVDTPAGSLLETQEQFSDFMLRFQFRRDASAPSVRLRAGASGSLEVTAIGRDRVRTYCRGDFAFKAVAVERTSRAEEPQFKTAWDDCEISLIGDELDVRINGRLCARAVACERTRGTIGFGSNPAKVVRNVVLIPVTP